MDYTAKPIDENLFIFEDTCDKIEEVFSNAEKLSGQEAIDKLVQYGATLAVVCEKLDNALLTYDFSTVLHISERMKRIQRLIGPYML